jgi:formate dehydrogenase subunit gamma
MSSSTISRIVRELKAKPGALLPVLHAIQEELGCIPEDAVPIIAGEMNLTRAEVHGVVTFYHDFRSHPPGRHVVKICQAESCQAAGSAALTAFARKRLGIDFHQTTGDRACSLEPVYCLGNCALSPSVMVDQEVFGRVSEERFDEIIEEARQS